MTVKELANVFWVPVLRGDVYMQGGVNRKACCINSCQCNVSELIPPKALVFEVLIQNAHILFEEHLDPSPPVLSSHVPDTQGAGGTKVVEVSSNNRPQGVHHMITSVAEWRLQVSQPEEHPQPRLAIPQRPPETVLSSTSDFTLSSATSLQTAMGPFS